MHEHTSTAAGLGTDDGSAARDHWERVLRAATYLDSAEEILLRVRTQVEAARRLVAEARELAQVERVQLEEGQRGREGVG